MGELDDLRADVEELKNLVRRGKGYTSPIEMAMRGYNYTRVRTTLQIPFDDLVDSGSALECFFQMPTNVNKIRQAKIWVQQKSYRLPSATASSDGASSPTSGSPSTTTGFQAIGSITQSTHNHTDPQGGNTGSDSAPGFVSDVGMSSTTVASQSHTHTTSISAHTHNLSSTMSEVAASGTLSLFVANDGTTYGSAIATGASSFVGTDLTAQLTTSSGDKRIKFTSTGKARLQILLLLDLVLVPLGPGQ